MPSRIQLLLTAVASEDEEAAILHLDVLKDALPDTVLVLVTTALPRLLERVLHARFWSGDDLQVALEVAVELSLKNNSKYMSAQTLLSSHTFFARCTEFREGAWIGTPVKKRSSVSGPFSATKWA